MKKKRLTILLALTILAAVRTASANITATSGNVSGAINAGAITTTMLAADSVTSAKIAAGTIVASDIAAGTITANEIAANTITAAKLNISSLSAITADLGSVTAGQIVVGSSNKLWLNEGSDGVFAIGGTTKANAAFYVSAAGSVVANNIQVTNFYGNQLQISGAGWGINIAAFAGGGNQRVCVDNNGDLYAGTC
jgi:hypothetical protein